MQQTVILKKPTKILVQFTTEKWCHHSKPEGVCGTYMSEGETQ